MKPEFHSSPSLKLSLQNAPPKKFGGLLTRKEAWRLSGRGWLLAALMGAALSVFLVLNIYSFLAINRPVAADVLVVEGWLNDYAIKRAVEEFRKGNYRLVFSTGGPVSGSGGYTNVYNTYASVTGERLIALGVPQEQVEIVPARENSRDRTYASAMALKQRLQERGMRVPALNVLTETTHARRSLLLFEEALEPSVKIGVISIANPDYDPQRWWRYSQGVKEVMSEALAYLYAVLLFHPKNTHLGA